MTQIPRGRRATDRPIDDASSLAVDPELKARGLDERLDRIEGLPTLPQLVTRLLTMTDDPGVSTRDVADLVGHDQSMAAAVLRLVNAPLYGMEGRISSIQHAVHLLGVRAVRNLAFSAVLVKSFGQPSRDVRFDRVRLWRHAVTCAAGARLIAQRLGAPDPEEAFLAGLVHDMGIVVLDQFFHEEFRRVVDLVTAMGTPLIEAESEIFGRNHSHTGRQLARRWNFPPSVAEAIGRHHDPTRARLDPTLAGVVHLADWLESTTDAAGIETPPDGPPIPTSGPALVGTPIPVPEPVNVAAPVAVRPDAFAASGPLETSVLGVLGLRTKDLDGLRLTVAEERWRSDALVAILG